jgi:hypothetical protein
MFLGGLVQAALDFIDLNRRQLECNIAALAADSWTIPS